MTSFSSEPNKVSDSDRLLQRYDDGKSIRGKGIARAENSWGRTFSYQPYSNHEKFSPIKLSRDSVLDFLKRNGVQLGFFTFHISDQKISEHLRVSFINKPEFRSSTDEAVDATFKQVLGLSTQKKSEQSTSKNSPPKENSPPEDLDDDRSSIDDEHESPIIVAANQISGDKIRDILAKTTFFEYLNSEEDQSSMIAVVQQFPLNKIDDILAKAVPFLEGVTDVYQQIDILIAVKEATETLPPGEDSPILDQARLLFDSTTGGDEKAEIINAVRKFPEDKRNDFHAIVSPFLEGINDGAGKAAVIRSISTFPKGKVTLEEAASSLRSVSDGVIKSDIISLFKKFLVFHKGDATLENFECCVKLLGERKDKKERDVLFRDLEGIQENLIKILNFVPFFNTIEDGFVAANLVKLFGSLPEDQQNLESLKGYKKLLEGVEDKKEVKDQEIRTFAVTRFTKLPEKKRNQRNFEGCITELKSAIDTAKDVEAAHEAMDKLIQFNNQK